MLKLIFFYLFVLITLQFCKKKIKNPKYKHRSELISKSSGSHKKSKKNHSKSQNILPEYKKEDSLLEDQQKTFSNTLYPSNKEVIKIKNNNVKENSNLDVSKINKREEIQNKPIIYPQKKIFANILQSHDITKKTSNTSNKKIIYKNKEEKNPKNKTQITTQKNLQINRVVTRPQELSLHKKYNNKNIININQNPQKILLRNSLKYIISKKNILSKDVLNKIIYLPDINNIEIIRPYTYQQALDCTVMFSIKNVIRTLPSLIFFVFEYDIKYKKIELLKAEFFKMVQPKNHALVGNVLQKLQAFSEVPLKSIDLINQIIKDIKLSLQSLDELQNLTKYENEYVKKLKILLKFKQELLRLEKDFINKFTRLIDNGSTQEIIHKHFTNLLALLETDARTLKQSFSVDNTNNILDQENKKKKQKNKKNQNEINLPLKNCLIIFDSAIRANLFAYFFKKTYMKLLSTDPSMKDNKQIIDLIENAKNKILLIKIYTNKLVTIVTDHLKNNEIISDNDASKLFLIKNIVNE